VDIKTGIIKIALEKKTSFFYKAETFIKAEIRKCIINKQETEESHWYPE
jgi:hypothetical protein